MFELTNAPGPIRPDLRTALEETWRWLAQPGTWWTATERQDIAAVGRAIRLDGALARHGLTVPAAEAASRLGGAPASTTPEWVAERVVALGEEAYTELLGIVSMVVAVDTFTRLMGSEPEPFLAPEPGEPTRTKISESFRKGKTWITMGPMPVPPYVLSIVPDAMAQGNTLEGALYMPGHEMPDPDYSRGSLHRTQIECVASSLSWANECFY